MSQDLINELEQIKAMSDTASVSSIDKLLIIRRYIDIRLKQLSN